VANPTNATNSKSYLLNVTHPCRERVYSLVGNPGSEAEPLDLTFDDLTSGLIIKMQLESIVEYSDGEYDNFSGNCASAEWEMDVPTVVSCKTHDADQDSTCATGQYDPEAFTVDTSDKDPDAIYSAEFDLDGIDQGIYALDFTWTAQQLLEIGSGSSRSNIVTKKITIHIRVNKCFPIGH